MLQELKKPATDEWGTGLDAANMALEAGKSVNQALHELHDKANSHGDAQMVDWIQGKFIAVSRKYILVLQYVLATRLKVHLQ